MPRLPTFLVLCAVLSPAAALAACGGDDEPAAPTDAGASTPSAVAIDKSSPAIPAPRGFTKNTVRIDAADAPSVAATTALTMYPSTAEDLKPPAVVLAGADDWRSILMAAPFAAKPLGFPLILTEGRNLPPVSQAALRRLAPEGAPEMNGAQALRISVSNPPEGLRTRSLAQTTPAGLSRAVDRQLTKLRGRPASRVLIVNSEDPASAAPAAQWAALSGDPILFVGAGQLPADTKAALQEHENPRIYVLGRPETVSRFVISQLQELGTVRRIAPSNSNGGAADLAIAFAKYSDGDFGFNFREPGHGLVFASAKDHLSAMAAAALSSGGTYGALLYVDRANHVEPSLRSYLLDIQPGYNDQNPPTLGFYNRGWIIGDESDVSVQTQGRLDQLLEIVRTDSAAADNTGGQQ